MIDRRTFLKLSAGALVLTAAGTLTGSVLFFSGTPSLVSR